MKMEAEVFLRKWRGGCDCFTKAEQAEIERCFRNVWLVYGDRELPVAFCTGCRRQVVTEGFGQHLAEGVCPRCGVRGMVFHEWRRREPLTELGLVYVHRRSADGRGVLSRSVAVRRKLSGKGENFVTSVDSWYAFYPEGSLCYGYHNGWRWWDDFKGGGLWYAPSPCWRRKWFCARRYVMSAYGQIRDDVSLSCGFLSLRSAAAGTELRYGLDELLRRCNERGLSGECFIEYFRRRRYPAYEWLLKMGLCRIVLERLKPDVNRYHCRWLNFRGRSVEDIFRGFRLSREDKADLLAHGRELSEGDVMAWAETMREVRLGEYSRVMQVFGADFWVRLSRVVPLRRAIGYVRRLKDRAVARSWLDYLDDCVELERNMEERRVLFPRDVERAHAETIRQLARKRLAKELKGFRRNSRRWRRLYSFSDGVFSIVIPREAEELIAEGEQMHNCVGGYIERCAQGLTDVVFIRRAAEPEVSLGTMEIHQGRVIQARARYNGPLPDEVMDFVKAFEKARLKEV